MKKIKPYSNYSENKLSWLGDMPSHWEIMRTKLLFDLATEPAPIGNSEELLSVYTAIGVKPRKELEARGNKASSTDNYWRVKKGDIIVNKLLAWMGAVGISEYDGVTSPAYDILRAKENVNPSYYNFLFRNPITGIEFKRNSRGIMDMRLRLYFTRFGDIKLPLPPIEEQDKIVTYIKFKLSKIDRFIRKKKALIKLLNEQKAGIINQAVTKGVPKRSFRLGSTTAAETNRSLGEVEVNAAKPCDAEAKHSVNAAKTCNVAAKQSTNAAKTCDVVAKRLLNAENICDTETKRSLSEVEVTDVLMKPSGIEWLGDIPAHWEVKPLKYFVSLNDEALSDKTDPEYELRYIDIGNVNSEGKIDEIVNYKFKNAPSRARRIVKQGDVIISTVRTYLKAITQIKSETDNLIVSTGFAVLRPNSEINCDFLNFSVRASYFIETICSESFGVSYPAINASELINLKIAIPPILDQLAIIRFIESETSQINSIISTIEKEISLVQEYRTALIAEAVTGKIDVRDYPIPVGWENDENEVLINEELMSEELINEGVEE